jgi:hypothetical protein
MKMRKVMIKKWIPCKRETTLVQCEEGTNCFEKEFETPGLFHQWASAYEESSEGFGNYTVALVELNDGTIEEVLPKHVQFVDLLDEATLREHISKLLLSALNDTDTAL